MKIAVVTWSDSNFYLEQASLKDDFTYETIVSVGVVIREDNEKIVLATDLVGEYDVRRVTVIPKVNIIHQRMSEDTNVNSIKAS